MMIHGSYAMVLIIHNQSFLILGRVLIYLFLLHIVAQIASHFLRFANIYNNIKVIKFKEPPRIC
jgi:hypothetical protein